MDTRIGSPRQPWFRCGIFSLVLLLCMTVISAAGADPERRLQDVRLERADGTPGFWRLSDHVRTADGAGPDEGTPVWIQFGFQGCQPCEVLAAAVDPLLPETVIRVYIHRDDVLLSAGQNNRQIWTSLRERAGQAPYERFIPLRRGSSRLQAQLCGPEATAIPSAVMVLPNGSIFGTVSGADTTTAADAVRAFVAQLGGTGATTEAEHPQPTPEPDEEESR